MQLKDLKTGITNKNLPHFLCFYGAEFSIINTYLSQMSESFSLPLRRYSKVNDAILSTKGFLPAAICVVKRDEDFLQQDLDNINILNNSIIVLVVDTVDKRLKSFKRHEENFVEFEKLNDKIAISTLQSNFNITSVQAEQLLREFETYSACEFELNKLTCFDSEQHQKLFDEFYNDGLFVSRFKNRAFEFSNAVLQKNTTQALNILQYLKDNKESSIRLLALLYTNFRNVCSIQFAKSATPESTGLTQPQIFAIQKNVRVFTNEQLLKVLRLIFELDTKIKSGEIDDEDALDIFLVRYI